MENEPRFLQAMILLILLLAQMAYTLQQATFLGFATDAAWWYFFLCHTRFSRSRSHGL